MITVSHTEVFGWETAIRGMRNALESWDRSDSGYVDAGNGRDSVFCIGEEDFGLMKKLVAAGTDHAKFMRMINVAVDITAPLYWWKEFDTYKVGTVANSCSTMHKIHSRDLTLDDFSHEHLLQDLQKVVILGVDGEKTVRAYDVLTLTIAMINHLRARYNETKEKKYWEQMIQLLPTSYNQKRTVQLNYQVLRNMYHARRFHKLDEWCNFCEFFIERLPYAELITMSGRG